MLGEVFTYEVLQPSLNQLSDSIPPELHGSGIDPVLDVMLEIGLGLCALTDR